MQNFYYTSAGAIQAILVGTSVSGATFIFQQSLLPNNITEPDHLFLLNSNDTDISSLISNNGTSIIPSLNVSTFSFEPSKYSTTTLGPRYTTERSVLAYVLIPLILLVLIIFSVGLYLWRRKKGHGADSQLFTTTGQVDYAEDVEDWERHLLEDGAVYRPTTSEPPVDPSKRKLRLEIDPAAAASSGPMIA